TTEVHPVTESCQRFATQNRQHYERAQPRRAGAERRARCALRPAQLPRATASRHYERAQSRRPGRRAQGAALYDEHAPRRAGAQQSTSAPPRSQDVGRRAQRSTSPRRVQGAAHYERAAWRRAQGAALYHEHAPCRAERRAKRTTSTRSSAAQGAGRRAHLTTSARTTLTGRRTQGAAHARSTSLHDFDAPRR
ncbi:hypothetical protein T492DRAFT_966638, partial [Pavlovales sp. CCMP2436]